MSRQIQQAVGIWNALLWGALAGIIVFLATEIAANLTRQSAPLTLSSFDVALRVISPLFLVGLTAGLVSHFRLAKLMWVPRLTWLLLTLLYFIAFAAGSLVANIIVISFGVLMRSGAVSQILTPVFILVIWVLLARLSIQAIIQPAAETAKSIGRQISLLIGQIFLAIFAAASWLPGTGTLILGGTIGLAGMIYLALYGTGRRKREDRTPAFLITLWAIPGLTIVVIILVATFGF